VTRWSIAPLYLAAFLSWGGTLPQHCPMGDAQALGVHTIISAPCYLFAFLMLARARLDSEGLALALPVLGFMVWQAYWGVQLFKITNIAGLSPCDFILRDPPHGFADDWFLDYAYAPYYVSVSLVSLATIAYAHWRYRRARLTS